MLIYLLLKVMIFLFTLLITILSSVFPVSISNLGLEDKIDSFYTLFENYSQFAFNGLYLAVGPFGISLLTSAMLLYTFYYTVYIPLDFLFKFFIKKKG